MDKRERDIILAMVIINVIFWVIIFYPSSETHSISNEESYSEPIISDKLSWGKNNITYYIETPKTCGKIEIEEIKIGFDKISEATNKTVTFTRRSNFPADIEISCSFTGEGCYSYRVIDYGSYKVKKEEICAHTAGLAQIIDIDGSTIKKARIEFIGIYGLLETGDFWGTGVSGFTAGQCQRGLTEVHEILHVFGYDHVDDPRSVMHPSEDLAGGAYLKDCSSYEKKYIDQEIIDDLIDTYQ